MKHLLLILLAFTLAASADAQTKIRGGRVSSARVIVAAPFYQNFGYGYGFRFSPFFNRLYDPFYDPFYRGSYDAFNRTRVVDREPSELQLNLDEIDNEYSFKISNVRDDNSFSGKERRKKIRELKYEQESALLNARRSFIRKEKTENKN